MGWAGTGYPCDPRPVRWRLGVLGLPGFLCSITPVQERGPEHHPSPGKKGAGANTGAQRDGRVPEQAHLCSLSPCPREVWFPTLGMHFLSEGTERLSDLLEVTQLGAGRGCIQTRWPQGPCFLSSESKAPGEFLCLQAERLHEPGSVTQLRAGNP